MSNAETITKVVLAVVLPLLTLIGFGSRRRRLRSEIKDNLALVDEIEKHQLLREHTLASGWLQGRIALDVARLSGQRLGTPTAPVKKGSVVLAAILAIFFGGWTYLIDRDGFVWYSVFPGIVSALMLISIIGLFTNRELPPEETAHLPPGAVPAPTETATERVATRVLLAASGESDERLIPGGQVDVVYKFIQMLQVGEYEVGLSLADDNWVRCRVQSWIWNNRGQLGEDTAQLERMAEVMLSEQVENEVWQQFVAGEASQFATSWGPINLSQYGAASRRRRLARDVDLVILAPVGTKGGYFVMSATAVPDALTFVVIRRDGKWKISNHVGMAPPTPGWPPSWWSTGDPAIDALPDA